MSKNVFQHMQMVKPKDCKSISEIRVEIDRIDKRIIELLGERLLYVKEIVNFKSNKAEVNAKTRQDELFEIRKKWAAQENIDPEVIEKIYKILVHYFIEEQLKLLKEK